MDMGPVPVLIAAHVCSMLGFATYAALLPQLRDAWALTNAQAGVVSGMFFGGYVASVSYWTAATDRVDGRKVYVAAALIAAAGSTGFGLLARGFASALFFQALLGAGIAGTYMPGLRLLSDRVGGSKQSRSIALYTSSFGIGTALSLALAGFAAAHAGWRAAFVVAGAGPLIAGALVLAFLRPVERTAQPAERGALLPFTSWARVLRHRETAGYVLGYAVHCLELFGSRSWMVAFLSFAAGLRTPSFPWQPPAIAAVVNLLSVPSSIVGNEVALRVGRRRLILLAMAASGASGVVLGFSASWHWAVVLALLIAYSLLVMADSATLTAGLVAVAPPDVRGAAMGL
jgi:MFS family permease